MKTKTNVVIGIAVLLCGASSFAIQAQAGPLMIVQPPFKTVRAKFDSPSSFTDRKPGFKRPIDRKVQKNLEAVGEFLRDFRKTTDPSDFFFGPNIGKSPQRITTENAYLTMFGIGGTSVCTGGSIWAYAKRNRLLGNLLALCAIGSGYSAWDGAMGSASGVTIPLKKLGRVETDLLGTFLAENGIDEGDAAEIAELVIKDQFSVGEALSEYGHYMRVMRERDGGIKMAALPTFVQAEIQDHNSGITAAVAAN